MPACTPAPDPDLIYLQDLPSLLQVEEAVSLLRAHGLTVVRTLAAADHARVAAVVVGLGSFAGSDAERFPNLRTVAKFGAGSDGIDVDALWRDRRIPVSCTADVATRDVAEWTLALIVLALRRAPRDIRRLGAESAAWRDIPRGISLSDAVVGIVGSGHIGTETARLLSGLAKKILFWNRSGVPVALPGTEAVADLAELAARADVVSLHVALGPSTRNLLGAAFFDRARKSGRTLALVNTARGGVVDEAALLQALEDGTITAACIDVWSAEGTKETELVRALRRHPSVLPTSHIGAYTSGVQRRYAMRCARNIAAVIAGRPDEVARYIVRPAA